MLRETVYVPILHFLSAERPEHGTSSHSCNFKKGGMDAKEGTQEKVETNSAACCKEFPNAGRALLHARAVAMLAAFIVSGLFHELIFCCITQRSATWEVTMFFIIHGFANVFEVFLRRKFPRKLPRPIAIVCTLSFLYVTALWLFMPPITRSGADLRIQAEFRYAQNRVVDLFSRYQGKVNDVPS
ncbi:hypothetical protein GOP47_0004988 [Adiantum capillus-veneris]|uniref:Wax synthase domain-containing protein n=1 Tax=Adiantum capillus-veneris TaxID=13818 RepID=A0A9D4ZL63_ADICA|nr:hypothetical protein GOP47_0004988 [Adiantum capillus-veneris]